MPPYCQVILTVHCYVSYTKNLHKDTYLDKMRAQWDSHCLYRGKKKDASIYTYIMRVIASEKPDTYM